MAHESPTSEPVAPIPEKSHRRRDLIASIQVWLPVLAVLGLVGFWGVDYFLRGDERYVPGSLAHVHASWQANCAACHVDALPLGGNNWAVALTGSTHVADAQCQTCHAGPAHHANERPGEVAGCTSCHREHRGRDAALARVANERCLTCHADLANHLKDGGAAKYLSVTDFTGDHPEFRRLRERLADPGKIAFNHKLHMTPGLRDVARTSVPFTLGHIPEPARTKYRGVGQVETDAVQLECASCHRADGSGPGGPSDLLAGLPRAAVQPVRGDGASMQPIVFELHCQACHPLTFGRKVEGDPKSELLAVRHRLQPEEIRGYLQGHFTEQVLQGERSFRERPLRPLPGKDPARAEESKRIMDLIVSKVSGAEKLLFSAATCQRCHVGLKPGQSVEPAAIPQVWFEQARFDHTAHRAVHCRTCHAGAYVSDEASKTSADVLLPGIATCRQCHAPSAPEIGGSGARVECVECHRYHGGDQPLHGKGASLRGIPRW